MKKTRPPDWRYLFAVLAIRRMRIRRLERGASAVRHFLRINFQIGISEAESNDLWSTYGPRGDSVQQLKATIYRMRGK